MADDADIAGDNALRYEAQQLAAFAAAAAAGGGEQLSECAEGGDKIPPARLAALAGRACLRCADCQGVFEGLKQRGLA